MELPDPGELGKNHVAVPATILVVSTIAGFFLLNSGGSVEPVVTTPYDGGNFSTDIGTPVRVNFFVSNPGQESIELNVEETELEFDADWNFWERAEYHTEDRISVTGEDNKSVLEIPPGDSRYVSAKFVTPLQEGVYEVELVGSLEDSEFSKGATIAVENRSSVDTATG